MKFIIICILSLFASIDKILPSSNIYFDCELSYSIDSTFISNKEKGFFQKLFDYIIDKKELYILKPYSIATNDGNNLYILDHGYNSPIKIDLKTKTVQIIEDEKNYFFPSLNSISCIDSNFIFTDSKTSCVYSINNDKISLFIDTTYLNQPTGIVYNKINKKIYISSTQDHKIKVFNKEGKFISEFGYRGNDSLGFNFPTFMACDNDGNIIILDNLNYRIKVYNQNEKLISIFGEQGDQLGYFAFPKGINIDDSKNIFIVDSKLKAFQVFNYNGDFLISSLHSKSQNEINFPTSVFIHNENIYITDYLSGKILVYKLNKESK